MMGLKGTSVYVTEYIQPSLGVGVGVRARRGGKERRPWKEVIGKDYGVWWV